jgi:hypothetical protein
MIQPAPGIIKEAVSIVNTPPAALQEEEKGSIIKRIACLCLSIKKTTQCFFPLISTGKN